MNTIASSGLLRAALCFSIFAVLTAVGNAWPYPVLRDMPSIILPGGVGDVGFNGSWDHTENDMNRVNAGQGIWYEEGGWYLRPKADGTGWEAGVLHPSDYFGPDYGVDPIRASWTPEGGWVIDQAPEGSYFGSYGQDPDTGEWGWRQLGEAELLGTGWNISVQGPDGTDEISSSANFTPGITNELQNNYWQQNWDNTLRNFYANNPELTSPYGPVSPSDRTQDALKLNSNLEFTDGVWHLPVE